MKSLLAILLLTLPAISMAGFTAPTAGANVSGKSVTLKWENEGHAYWVRAKANGVIYSNSGEIGENSYTLYLPEDGSAIEVILFSRNLSGGWNLPGDKLTFRSRNRPESGVSAGGSLARVMVERTCDFNRFDSAANGDDAELTLSCAVECPVDSVAIAVDAAGAMIGPNPAITLDFAFQYDEKLPNVVTAIELDGPISNADFGSVNTGLIDSKYEIHVRGFCFSID